MMVLTGSLPCERTAGFWPESEEQSASWKLSNGTAVMIRSIRQADAPRLERFLESLLEPAVPEGSLPVRDGANASATSDCKEFSLVALHRNYRGEEEMIAAARLQDATEGGGATFTLLVADRFHAQGLGTELLRRLARAAQSTGRQALTADIAPDNHAMQRVCLKLGFTLHHDAETSVVQAFLPLFGHAAAAPR